MLTRFQVSGFKSLVGIDVRFAPFTCIAGPNGAGKSNLFDAITFLAALADRPLLEAALSVRSSERAGELESIFHHVGDVFDERLSFDAEMLIPATGVDDIGQEARASITFVRYRLVLQRRVDPRARSPRLEIVEESLTHIKRGDAKEHLPFRHSKEWRDSVVSGRRSSAFISTDKAHIRLHGDSGGGTTGGPPRQLPRASLLRTALSSVNASENPTAMLVRREMQSWRRLQLEPAAMRSPDELTAPRQIGLDGAHLPATLARLAALTPNVTERIANRLAELVDGIREVEIDEDPQREILSIRVRDASRTWHRARSLSDGTLRFLALAILEEDPETRGVLCFEEPENGIHPQRIEQMLRLLQGIAVDTEMKCDDDNPLRQVIINTHSPAVVARVPAESLLYAAAGRRTDSTRFACLPETWRAQDKRAPTMPLGSMLAYLNPLGRPLEDAAQSPRVMDRADLRQLVLPWAK